MLRLEDAAALWALLQKHVAEQPADSALNFDLSRAEVVDGAAMAMLVHARAELQRKCIGCEIQHASGPVAELVRLYRGDVKVRAAKRRKPKSAFEQIGDATVDFVNEVQARALVFGPVGGRDARRHRRSPKTGNFREVAPIMERTGADALPIVLLINFLVGLVMAFQASVQLKRFGANILVADLIGISMTRELGPLMTAIVVCGRSGAAFAAELGTMKVNEEIDALRVLGLSPMRYLVLPRVLGMFLVLPLLALFADLVGILGGTDRGRHAPRPHDDLVHAADAARREALGRVFGRDQGGRLRRRDLPHRLPAGPCCHRWRRGRRAAHDGRGGVQPLHAHSDRRHLHRDVPPDRTMTEPIVEVSQLTIGWGTRTLLENLNFKVERGDVFVILGGSGSGKSTLLRHLIGLEQPLAGEIRTHGVRSRRPRRSRSSAARRPSA